MYLPIDKGTNRRRPVIAGYFQTNRVAASSRECPGKQTGHSRLNTSNECKWSDVNKSDTTE